MLRCTVPKQIEENREPNITQGSIYCSVAFTCVVTL